MSDWTNDYGAAGGASGQGRAGQGYARTGGGGSGAAYRTGGYGGGRYGGPGQGSQDRGGLGTGTAYQLAPIVIGGLMAALGLRRGGWLGYGVALAGLGVMQQSLTGKPDIAEWVGLGDQFGLGQRAVTVSHSVTINRSPEELFQYWRQFSNLPRFMRHIESIEVLDDRRSHWVAKAPAGLRVAWDAEITDEQPGRRLAWRSMEGADVPNWGHVEFQPAPGGQGTEVHAVIRYEPPAGALGRAIAKLLGEEPQQQMREDLNRFKRIMETGEGQLSGEDVHGQRSMMSGALTSGQS